MNSQDLDRICSAARDCACDQEPLVDRRTQRNMERAAKINRKRRLDQTVVEDIAHQFYDVELNPAWVLVAVAVVIFIGYCIVGDPVVPDQPSVHHVRAK